MFTTTFSEPVLISDQQHFASLFGSDALHLVSGGTVRAVGQITLGPNVVFAGACELRGPIRIDNGSFLTNVTLGAGTVVRSHSVISGLTAGERNIFGPSCFIRDSCTVGNDCILGAHVEAARSSFASGVKISHRAFIGDAELGARTIIGAGVVFCNYLDGKGRRPTTIGTDVMVGSGTMLVAPLSIGDGAVVAAGSVVTKSLPPGSRLVQKRR